MKGDSQRPIRILLVDDKLFIREGLAAVLSRQDDMEIIVELVGITASHQVEYIGTSSLNGGLGNCDRPE